MKKSMSIFPAVLILLTGILMPVYRNALTPISFRPRRCVRFETLLLMGLVGLIGLGALSRMTLREERQNRTAAAQSHQAPNEREPGGQERRALLR